MPIDENALIKPKAADLSTNSLRLICASFVMQDKFLEA